MSRPSGPHLDPERLAEHLEGLLPPEQAAAAQAHVETCPDCRRLEESLSDVTRLLRAEPDPGPVPELVARRIDRALAAERGPAAAAPARPGPLRPRRRWLPKLAAAAAAVAVLGVAVPTVFRAGTDGGDSTAQSDTGAGGAESGPEPAVGAPAVPTDSTGYASGPALERLREAARAAAATAATPNRVQRDSAGACRLDRVEGVAGDVVSVEPAPGGAPGHVLVALRAAGRGTALILAACSPQATVLARVDVP